MIKNSILPDEDFNFLKNYFKNHSSLSQMVVDEFGRKLIGDQSDPLLVEYSNKMLPYAREIFKSDTLLPSYSLFAEYSDKIISLYKHKDANACTYTLDLVLYQEKPWPIWVDGVEYIAEENDAICFMGEDKYHWRETISDNTDKYGLIFFHYVEPDHWWFTKGKDHVEKIREAIRMEQNNELN